MTSEQVADFGARRSRRRRGRTRPWIGAEYLLCLCSLIIALSMVSSTSWSVAQEVIRSEQALAAEENKGDSYITYIYNAFSGKETAESSQSAQEVEGFDPAQVDLTQFEGDDGYAGMLYAEMGEDSERIASILSHYEGAVVTVDGEETTVGQVLDGAIPERLLKMAVDYPQTMDFVKDYPEKYDQTFEIDLSGEESLDTVPALLQWDERWGYLTYGDGLLGYTGCGPTCVSMVAMYLTGDVTITPDVVAHYADENDYYTDGSGSKWTLMTSGAANFGVTGEEQSVTEWSLKHTLEEGGLVICSMGPGDFTLSGHFIVITGYEEGEGFRVNDPNSEENTARTWTYNELASQIRSAWSYTAS